MKNKIFAALLAVCMALPLVGCGEVKEKTEVTKRTRSEKENVSSPEEANQSTPPVSGSSSAPVIESTSTPVSEPESTDISSAGDEFPMPDLVNMTWEEADQKYGEYLTLVASQEYSDVEKGRIIRHDSPEGSLVKPGQTVAVTVSAGSNTNSVEVPKLTGISIAEAQKKCGESHLNPTIKPVSSTLPEGTVIAQSIKPGEMVDRNTAIELTVSAGKAPTVTADLNIMVPSSASGVFEFQYYVDGKLQVTADPDIRDLSIANSRTI